MAEFLSSNLTISDAGAAILNEGLSKVVTIEAALGNPVVATKIKTAAKAEMFDAVDKKINAIAEMFGLTDEQKAALSAETNTFNRIDILGKITNDIMKAKVAGASKDDKAALLQKIDDLNAGMNALKTATEAEKNKLKDQYATALRNKSLRGLLSGKKWANDKAPSEVNEEMALLLLQKQAEKDGAKIVYDEKTDSLKLVDANAPDLAFHQSNKPVQLTDYFNSVVANANLISAQPEGGPAKGDPGKGANGLPNPPAGGSANPVLEKFNAQMDAAIAAASGK
jgi:hypothetical protein